MCRVIYSDIDEDLEEFADIVSRLGSEREPLVSITCSCDVSSRSHDVTVITSDCLTDAQDHIT